MHNTYKYKENTSFNKHVNKIMNTFDQPMQHYSQLIVTVTYI